jgi:hypothetical protein
MTCHPNAAQLLCPVAIVDRLSRKDLVLRGLNAIMPTSYLDGSTCPLDKQGFHRAAAAAVEI